MIGAEEVLAAADDKLKQAVGVAIDETVAYHGGTHTPDKPKLLAVEESIC